MSTIASLLEDQLKQEKLSILSEKNLVAAVNEFVDKNEKEAISEWVNWAARFAINFQNFIHLHNVALWITLFNKLKTS